MGQKGSCKPYSDFRNNHIISLPRVLKMQGAKIDQKLYRSVGFILPNNITNNILFTVINIFKTSAGGDDFFQIKLNDPQLSTVEAQKLPKLTNFVLLRICFILGSSSPKQLLFHGCLSPGKAV